MDDNRIGDRVDKAGNEATQTASDLAGKEQTAAAEAGSTIQGAASETVRQVSDATAKAYGQGVQASKYLSRNTPNSRCSRSYGRKLVTA